MAWSLGRANRSSRTRRRSGHTRPFQELILSPWIVIPLAVAIGMFVAIQTISPQPRYVKLIVGALSVLIVLRFSLSKAVAAFIYVFCVPTFVFFADTNLLLIGLLLLSWVTQVVMKREPRPRSSPVDWAIGIYLLTQLLSFVNLETADGLHQGIQSMVQILAGGGLFFLLYNTVRTEVQLRRIINALLFVTAFVHLTAFVEYFFDGYQLVPEWYLHRGGQSPGSADRVGGVFGYHALLSDFSAIMFLVQVTYALRTKSKWARILYIASAVVSVMVITMTVNRGGAIIWLLGCFYFLFLMRGRVNWARILVLAPILAGVVLGWQSLISSGRIGELRIIGRLVGTQIERGVPDTRVRAWAQILERIPEHFWIGHGPYFELGTRGGTQKVVWPHSAYLFYLFTSGIFGLCAWLWILVRLIWLTFPGLRADVVRWSFAESMRALVHIQLLMFATAQLRASHQRGNVYLYLMWILFAIAAITWKMSRERRQSGANATAA